MDAAAAHRSAPPRSPWLPLAGHAAAALWVGLMLGLGAVRPDTYEQLLQEDRFVEWWTVTLFAAAGVFALTRALRDRRVFDGLVGAFCLFVAGEEFSWGQRLLGFTAPDAFLEHNRQQELTIHNFADVFGQPKWVLVAALVGFGLLLPTLARVPGARRLLDRIGATAAGLALVPWFAAAVVLLVTYPLPYTGEWSEALAGGLFLVAFAPAAGTVVTSAGVGAVAALALSFVSGAGRGATPGQLACVRAEVEALVDDLAYGRGATGRLAGAASVHKRIYTAIQEGYVAADGLDAFAAAECGEGQPAERRRHAVDPWGTAYWLELERADGMIRLTVYSFGPNRRRDGPPAVGGGDDVAAEVRITL